MAFSNRGSKKLAFVFIQDIKGTHGRCFLRIMSEQVRGSCHGSARTPMKVSYMSSDDVDPSPLSFEGTVSSFVPFSLPASTANST